MTMLNRAVQIFALIFTAGWLIGCGGETAVSPTTIPETATEPTYTPAEPTMQPTETAVLPSPTPHTTEPASRTDTLRRLLSYIPDNEDTRSYLTYGNYSAWLESWQVNRPNSLEEVDALSERERDLIFFLLGQQITPPQRILNHSMPGEMVDHYGFDFFHLTQYIEAGRPPKDQLILLHTQNNKEIEVNLLELGYETSLLEPDTSLYAINEDFGINPDATIRPIIRGDLNRIGIANDLLLIAKATEIVETAVTTHQENRAISTSPDYAALLESLDSSQLNELGMLIGVILLGEPVVVDVPAFGLDEEGIQQLMEALQFEDSPLPPHIMTGYATFQDGSKTYLSLHALFLKSDMSNSAADVLAERMDNYISVATRDAIPWRVVDQFSISDDLFDTAVVILEVKQRADSEMPTISWIEMVFINDLLFLMPQPDG